MNHDCDMPIAPVTNIGEIKQLLSACELPVSDIAQSESSLFLAIMLALSLLASLVLRFMAMSRYCVRLQFRRSIETAR